MAKTNLTDEEKRIIAKALSNNTEPPPGADDKTFSGIVLSLMFNADKLP